LADAYTKSKIKRIAKTELQKEKRQQRMDARASAAAIRRRMGLMRLNGVRRLLGGYLLAAFFLLALGVTALNKYAYQNVADNYMAQQLFFGTFGALGILLARSGHKRFRALRLYRRVRDVVAETPELSLEELAARLGMRKKPLQKRLLLLLKRSLLPDTWLDLKTLQLHSVQKEAEKRRLQEEERALQITENPEICERVPCPACGYENLVPEGKIGVCARCGAAV